MVAFPAAQRSVSMKNYSIILNFIWKEGFILAVKHILIDTTYSF